MGSKGHTRCGSLCVLGGTFLMSWGKCLPGNMTTRHASGMGPRGMECGGHGVRLAEGEWSANGMAGEDNHHCGSGVLSSIAGVG